MVLSRSGEAQLAPTAQSRALAEAVWAALRQMQIVPTPRNYELLYTHFDGTKPDLSRRLEPHLQHQNAITQDDFDAIYEECLGGDTSTDAIDSGADALAEAAQGLVDQVSGNQEALDGYGSTLATWAKRLHGRTTVDDLVKAVAVLMAETTRASERNRTLEQQLSASTIRIAKLRQDLVEVRQEATTDGLTGIANRKAFEAKLRRAVAGAKAETSSTFSLLLLDVDHFKRFNDTHGHRTGDHVLRLVARLLSDNVKGRDSAARYGGEEFGIILSGADLDAGVTVAEQMRERLSSQRLIKRGTGEAVGQITISIGVAQHRLNESGTALVERADHALYEAKRSGRNRVCAARG